MNDVVIQKIVVEVIRRLIQLLGVDGRRGVIIVIFSGATVQLPEAASQVRSLILDGYRVRLVFTEAAERLYAGFIREQLEGFPYDEMGDDAVWLLPLKQACAVLVPMLSVNTLSKLALLIADNLSLNLILHALWMGKPVIVARNGADPDINNGRAQLGFSQGVSTLSQTLRRRLQTVASFGCCLSDVSQLRDRLYKKLNEEADLSDTEVAGSLRNLTDSHQPSRKIVTAALVRNALRSGSGLIISSDAVVTPLARDLVMQHRLALAVPDSELPL